MGAGDAGATEIVTAAASLRIAATRSQMRRNAHRLSGQGDSNNTVTSVSARLSANRTLTPSQTRK